MELLARPKQGFRSRRNAPPGEANDSTSPASIRTNPIVVATAVPDEKTYEQAIRSAHANGFIPNEAIAYEVAARFTRVLTLTTLRPRVSAISRCESPSTSCSTTTAR